MWHSVFVSRIIVRPLLIPLEVSKDFKHCPRAFTVHRYSTTSCRPQPRTALPKGLQLLLQLLPMELSRCTAQPSHHPSNWLMLFYFLQEKPSLTFLEDVLLPSKNAGGTQCANCENANSTQGSFSQKSISKLFLRLFCFSHSPTPSSITEIHLYLF